MHKKMCNKSQNNQDVANGSSLARPEQAKGKWLLCGSRFWPKLQGRRQEAAPVVGLQNQGNTCYLNAILQCIVHTPLLYTSLKELPSHCLRKEDERRWLFELRQLLEDMSEAQDRGQMAMSSKISELITVNKEFTQGQQADAHEAFMFIMERLLDGCLAIGSDGVGGVGCYDLSVTALSKGSPAAKETLERNSLMGFLFGMDLGQSVRCRSCGACSKKSHAEYCIYLRAATGLVEDTMRSMGDGYGSYGSYGSYGGYQHRRSSSGSMFSSHAHPDTSLEELFEAYTRVEQIDGWACEKCNSRLGCDQSTYIKNKPNILVVYISRQKDTNRYGKIKRMVQFSEHFDLSPFLEVEEVPKRNRNLRYRLYGVVVHKDVNNSTFFGHYIAYVRSRTTWFKMDDASVTRVPWSTVQDQQADLLFYAAEQVDPVPWAEDLVLDKQPEVPQKTREATATNGTNGIHSAPVLASGSVQNGACGTVSANDGRMNGTCSSSRLEFLEVQKEVTGPSTTSPRPSEVTDTVTVTDGVTHCRVPRHQENSEAQEVVHEPVSSGGFFDFDDLEEKEEALKNAETPG